MPPETQAEFFIRTVAELHEEHRTRLATQQRLQQKTRAAKFIQTFPANRNECHSQAREISQLARDARFRDLRARDTAALRQLVSALEAALRGDKSRRATQDRCIEAAGRY